MSIRIAAVTGGSGFVGSHIVAALAAGGWRVRLLARRAPQHPLLAQIPVELVLGDLADSAALARLVEGATAVVHAAGLVKARRAVDFFAINEGGTERLAAAAAREGGRSRFVLISSQAARQPRLSAYAASKRAGEAALIRQQPGGGWTMLRPGIVYGPWDKEGAALLRLASGRGALVPKPPSPRLAMIHARDFAAAVAAVCANGPDGLFELSDGTPDGHAADDLLRQLGRLVGNDLRLIPVPDALFHLAGAASDGVAAITRRAAIFGRGKANEILHRDWRPDPAMRMPETLWTPTIDLAAGLAETVAWWRANSD